MKEFLKEFTYLEIFNETNLRYGSGDRILDLGNDPERIEMSKLKLFCWRKYVELRSNAPQLITTSKLPIDPGSFKLLIGKLSKDKKDKNVAIGKENISLDENGDEVYSYSYRLKYTPSASVQKLFEDADRQYIEELTQNETLQKNEPEVAKFGGYDNWLKYRAWLKTWPVKLRNLSFTLLLGVLCIAAIAFAIPSLAVSLLPSAAFTISSIAYICVKSALIAGICLACAGLASGIVAYKDYLAIGNTADSTKEADYTREESEEDERPVDDHSSSSDQENDLEQGIVIIESSEPNAPIIDQTDVSPSNAKEQQQSSTIGQSRALPTPKPSTQTAVSAAPESTTAKQPTVHVDPNSKKPKEQRPTAMDFFKPPPTDKAKETTDTESIKPPAKPTRTQKHKG